MKIDARKMKFDELNESIRKQDGDCEITGCLGQRFIAAGADKRRYTIFGTPGNALGAYLNGAQIDVYGNAQDAVGDTMNAGSIVVHGNIGDTAGYAMRGGEIFVKGNAGYRAGVHMKAYQEKLPVMVIGGRVGSFLSEYQAGGIIIVLGLHTDGKKITGFFPCTGMHGGKVYLRSDCRDIVFPEQVTAHKATEADKDEIKKYVLEYCRLFSENYDIIMKSDFTVVTPDNNNPYQEMFVAN